MLLGLFIFILGLCVGSFLNVLIDRLPKEKSILGRSKCDHCGRVLSWLELVPVLSFLWQRGRCRYCGKKISWQYPAVEILTALIFLLISNFEFLISKQIPIPNSQIPNIFVTCYALCVICVLIVIFFSDLKYFIIPDKIIYPAIGVALVWLMAFNLFFDQAPTMVGARGEVFDSARQLPGLARTISSHLSAALVAGGFFIFLVLVTRGKGMGLGDVKLVIFMGLVLGWPKIALALFLAFFSGALVGLGLVVLGRKTLKSEIPFGTFLSAATLFVIFLGDKILALFY